MTQFDTTTAKTLWQQRLSTTRFSVVKQEIIPKTVATGNVRSNFHIDYDRVVFSRAFRKLGRKTQVHPFATSDHTHNRLTHSVEVASVGRSIGNQVGACLESIGILPDDFSANSIGAVVQVACLAHDLGNPPFGHTGEAAIREWFSNPNHARYLDGLTDNQKADICTYEGNAHSLRTVLSLEMYKAQGGMRLTAASVGTLIKYPWDSRHLHGKKGQKFNIYQSELPLFRHIANTLNLPKIAENHWARHPLSYLMEAADDICYALLDLEDAVELGLISLDEFSNTLEALIDIDKLSHIKDPDERCGAMRGSAIGRAVEGVADAFMRHHDALLTGTFADKDLLSVCDDNIKLTLKKAKQLAANKVFHHNSKLATEIAAFGCLGTILDLLIPAVFAKHQGGHLNTKHELSLGLLGFNADTTDELYGGYMSVLDFICGLTDNTAARLARDISGVGMI